MKISKFDRELAREAPAKAVSKAMDEHRFEAVRMGRSEPEVIYGLMVQARHHGGSVSYYLDGARSSRNKATAAIMDESVRENA